MFAIRVGNNKIRILISLMLLARDGLFRRLNFSFPACANRESEWEK